MGKGDTSLGGDHRAFPETLSELLEGIRHPSPELRRAALEQLGRDYWKPIYAYIRIGWAKSNEDAKDLTQAFFSWLAERGTLDRYDPARASFKTFLKSLLRHFLQRDDTAQGRIKRGGAATLVSLEGSFPSLEAALAGPKTPTPEEIFDREWLRELADRALEQVRQRLVAKGREKVFRAFEAYALKTEGKRPTYEELGRRLNMSVSDITNHLHAVREELRNEIRSRLKEISSSPDESEEEWNAFLGR